MNATAHNQMAGGEVFCRVENLKKYFPIRRGFLRRQVGAIQAIDGISFDIFAGETLGLVGESGSGKSTTGRSILQLERPTSGRVLLNGADLTVLNANDLRRTRRNMQMIFQDPYASLNPRMRVGAIIREPLDIHDIGDKSTRSAMVLELLEMVGLSGNHARQFPHEFSGGQRQRVGIARALATRPKFIVADEPISALDVSIQAQIVNLLADLKDELGLTYLFIAHDLSMVRHLSDRVAVMYLGRIVEMGSCADIFNHALHPYTQALISAIPVPDPGRKTKKQGTHLQSDIPNPAAPPPGCRFHTRCPLATDLCRREDPEFREIGNDAASHRVACHYAGQSPQSDVQERI
jgi:oligopeptide/dipeptide ABC transporter ATP-binding protein